MFLTPLVPMVPLMPLAVPFTVAILNEEEYVVVGDWKVFVA
jgi:hypothetical protein